MADRGYGEKDFRNDILAGEVKRLLDCDVTDATREQIHSCIDAELDKKELLKRTKAAARATSVRLLSIPVAAEVWRDPTSDDEIFVVRWEGATLGYGDTREEFVRWFGEEAVGQVPEAL